MSNVLGIYLDPIDALFTIFFSIMFALLFTLSNTVLIDRGVISPDTIRGSGRDLFITILGAVTAWGIIDGVIYILGEVFTRRERYRLLRYVQASDNEESGVAAISDDLGFILEPITSDEQRRAIYQDILGHLYQSEPQATGMQRGDVVGALVTVLLSIVAVLPPLLPLLMLPDNIVLALCISNVVSLLVVFYTGYNWGIHTDTHPWKTGLLLTSICLAVVVVAAIFGG